MSERRFVTKSASAIRLRRQLAAHLSDALRRRLRDARSHLQSELEAHHRACLEAKSRFLAAGLKHQSRLLWSAIRLWFRPPQRDLTSLASK